MDSARLVSPQYTDGRRDCLRHLSNPRQSNGCSVRNVRGHFSRTARGRPGVLCHHGEIVCFLGRVFSLLRRTRNRTTADTTPPARITRALSTVVVVYRDTPHHPISRWRLTTVAFHRTVSRQSTILVAARVKGGRPEMGGLFLCLRLMTGYLVILNIFAAIRYLPHRSQVRGLTGPCRRSAACTYAGTLRPWPAVAARRF